MNKTPNRDESNNFEDILGARSPFIDTIKNSREFVAEMVDTGLAAVKETHALEIVPIISWAAKVYAITENFHKFRFIRNVKAFLQSVQVMDTKEIERLSQKLSDDPSFAEEFLDTLMTVLYEAEKPEKATILGKLVTSLALEKLTNREYEDLSQMILSASVPALRALPAFFAETSGLNCIHSPRNKFEALLMSLGVGRRSGTLFEVDENGTNLYLYGMDGILRN